MSNGYGTHSVTCGRCGDSYSASGVCGDLKAQQWLLDHERDYCRERTDEERAASRDRMAARVQHRLGFGARLARLAWPPPHPATRQPDP